MRYLMTTMIASCLLVAPNEKLQAWTPEELMQMKTISDVQISPENDSVLFVATEAVMTDDKSAYLTRIYKASSDGKEDAVPFSSSEISSCQPRWSPDGQWIAFISARSGSRNLYLIRSSGGEATPLVVNKKDVQTFSWSPDGQKIAFVMSDEKDEEKNRKKRSLAYIYKQETMINRLWIIDVFPAPSLPKSLTTDDYCVRGVGDFGTINSEFDWSPDGKTIAFAYAPGMGLDYYHLDSSLATVDVATAVITPWEKKAVYEALPRYSPDGNFVAYLSNDTPEGYAINRRVALRKVDGQQFQLLAPTYNEGAFLAGPTLLGWTRDSASILFFEPKGTKYHIALQPIDGSPSQELDTGDCFFKEPALSYDKTMLGFIAQAPDSPPEVHVAKLDDFEPKQVSSLNRFLHSLPKIKTELIEWEASDGLKIDGLLTYPIGYEDGKQYPLLLVIHGGPMGFYDETFLGTPNPYPYASFAEAGFLVFRPNPRGSTGYGKTFRCANYNDWGGMDFSDCLTGMDSLINKGMADPERLGVMGWSYGGYMTAWTITQTQRFKAASMGAGFCNLVSMSGGTDLHRILPDYIEDFFNNKEFYEKRSPINYVQNVSTPCMIQHGTADLRTPVSGAYEFYHALNRLGKNPVLVIYPGMEHRITDPKMQLDAMQRNLAWFKKHILSE